MGYDIIFREWLRRSNATKEGKYEGCVTSEGLYSVM